MTSECTLRCTNGGDDLSDGFVTALSVARCDDIFMSVDWRREIVPAITDFEGGDMTLPVGTALVRRGRAAALGSADGESSGLLS